MCEPPHSWRMWCAISVHCLKFPNWGFPSRASEFTFILHFLLQITTEIDSTHWITLRANINLPLAKGHWNLSFCLIGTQSAGEIMFFIFIYWNKSVCVRTGSYQKGLRTIANLSIFFVCFFLSRTYFSHKSFNKRGGWKRNKFILFLLRTKQSLHRAQCTLNPQYFCTHSPHRLRRRHTLAHIL